MPNKKSAEKRMRQSEKNRLYNRYWTTRCKTAVKKVLEAVESKDTELAAKRFDAAQGVIDKPTLCAVEAAVAQGRRPPWGTPLGGEIYLHEGDVAADWSAGCISLAAEDMAVLYAYRSQIEDVEIRP